MVTLKIKNPFNAPVYHMETVTSTMDISRQFALDNKPHGTVITADFQEAGRGRLRGRYWQMEKKSGLPFTILLRYLQIENIPPALTLRTGLAVSAAIEDCFPSLKNKVFVKWPNDIMINSRKTAGILCEAESGNVHIGIGINTAQKIFPAYLQEKAASIAIAANTDVTLNDKFILLEKILEQLHEELISAEKIKTWKTRLENRLYKKGSNVIFIEGEADSGREIKGCLCGIGETGELLILPDGGKTARSFFTGELKI